MFKGNAGLIALCVLLGGAAFAVLFVAPRYFDGDEMLPPKVVAEAGKAAGSGETPDAGETPAADTAKAEDDTADGDAEADRADLAADEPGTEEQTAETATTDEGDGASSEVAESPAGAAPEDTETAASDTADEENAPKEETDAAPAADEENAPAEETATAPAGGEAEPVVPAFDVLRVEPDGSMVVAGRAEPGSKVDIVDGDDVLASAEAGPAGNFAAVLDEPLAPGDYQIALRASDEDGEPVRSEETATVSVPSGDDEELLALVTRPGEASRIVTAPEAPDDRETTGDEASATAESNDPAVLPESEDATTAADEAGSETATADAEKDVAADVEAAPLPDDESATVSAEDEAGTGENSATESAEQSIAALDDQPAADAKADRPLAADAASEDDPETAARDEGEPPTGTLATQEAPKGDRPVAEAVENVRIDAVEVEGDQLYVTGSAEPGASVGIYVDNVFAGSGEVTEEGRFLVEERMPMTVGKHTIRADMTIEGEVAARAIVPFTRPDEGTAAAVARTDRPENEGDAPSESGGGQLSAEADAAEPPASADEGAPVSEASREPAESSGGPAEVANGSGETAEQPAVQPSPAMPEADETAAPPADGDESAPDAPELAARDEIEEPEPAPSPSGEQAATPPSAEVPAATPPPAEAPATTPPSAEVPAATPLPAEEPTAVPPATAEAETIVTLRQEPLEPTDSSVIIRRGDTLWEISRRVYGQGVRYTTIYLANDEQIGNPDLILPGQVFSVPDEALDNAEEIHRRRMLGLDG